MDSCCWEWTDHCQNGYGPEFDELPEDFAYPGVTNSDDYCDDTGSMLIFCRRDKVHDYMEAMASDPKFWE